MICDQAWQRVRGFLDVESGDQTQGKWQTDDHWRMKIDTIVKVCFHTIICTRRGENHFVTYKEHYSIKSRLSVLMQILHECDNKD